MAPKGVLHTNEHTYKLNGLVNCFVLTSQELGGHKENKTDQSYSEGEGHQKGLIEVTSELYLSDTLSTSCILGNY